MQPTDPQVRRFLAGSMIVRVAAKAPDGRPFLTPYWFVRAGHRLCITTGRNALLARYVEENPRVVMLFEADRSAASSPILRLTGTAHSRAGFPPLPIVARSVWKYTLSIGGLHCELVHRHLLQLRWRYYAQATPGWIEVTPETATFVEPPLGPSSLPPSM